METDFNKILAEAVKKAVQKEVNGKILTHDADEIVKQLIPVLDDLISKRVKSHFAEIASFMFKMTNKK